LLIEEKKDDDRDDADDEDDDDDDNDDGDGVGQKEGACVGDDDTDV